MSFINRRLDESRMIVDNLTCVLHQPPGLQQKFDQKGEEVVQPLPPTCPTQSFCVDEYQACPPSWMHGSARAASYFVPVEVGRGLWFDFNENARGTHDIAAMVSIQGVNAITGQKTIAMRLEQYKEKCPIHDKEFGHNRHCEECGYQWPAQNYICSNAQPNKQFWIDGFRNADGVVRQYLITEEECRGVAAQTIGEDRVFAIGIAFFRSKNPKPLPIVDSFKRLNNSGGIENGQKTSGFNLHGLVSNKLSDSPQTECFKSADITSNVAFGGPACAPPPQQYTNSTKLRTRNMVSPSADKEHYPAPVANEDYWIPAYPPDDVISLQQLSSGNANLDSSYDNDNSTAEMDYDSSEQEIAVEGAESGQVLIVQKKLEVGAGSKINQRLYNDPKDLDYWDETPVLVYINYVSVADAHKIINAGKRDLTKGGEGFLAGLVKGNK